MFLIEPPPFPRLLPWVDWLGVDSMHNLDTFLHTYEVTYKTPLRPSFAAEMEFKKMCFNFDRRKKPLNPFILCMVNYILVLICINFSGGYVWYAMKKSTV